MEERIDGTEGRRDLAGVCNILGVFQSPLYIAYVGSLATDDQHDQSKGMRETVMSNSGLRDMLVLSALGFSVSLARLLSEVTGVSGRVSMGRWVFTNVCRRTNRLRYQEDGRRALGLDPLHRWRQTTEATAKAHTRLYKYLEVLRQEVWSPGSILLLYATL